MRLVDNLTVIEPGKYIIDPHDRVYIKYSENERYLLLGYEIEFIRIFLFRKSIMHISIAPEQKWQPTNTLMSQMEKERVAKNLYEGIRYLGIKCKIYMLTLENGKISEW